MHFWFWFFSLLAALVAWRQECVSTLQAVCNKICERSNKNCVHQVATLYAGKFDSNTAFMNQIYCTSGKYILFTQNNCENKNRNKMTER